jgi:predicted nucleotidyltransferase
MRQEEEIADPARRIRGELEQIEHAEDVRIVYACESGSRAWGFESQDSDYDVRFLYVHPAAWYLRVQPGRDVIERPLTDNLDLSGWDLRKTLQLLRKSNPPLLEWLQSPIVYCRIPTVVSKIREVTPEYYSPTACHYHYLHMAEGNYREYLRGQDVWIKKYFYVLRPVLACLWIERGHGIVPTEFSVLVDRVVDSADLGNAIDDLLQRKRSGEELDRAPRIPVISDFLDREIARMAEKRDLPTVRAPADALDKVFLSSIVELHGEGLGE